LLLWDLTMEMKRGTVFFSDTRIVLKWVKTACIKEKNIHQYISTITCDAHISAGPRLYHLRRLDLSHVTKH